LFSKFENLSVAKYHPSKINTKVDLKPETASKSQTACSCRNKLEQLLKDPSLEFETGLALQT